MKKIIIAVLIVLVAIVFIGGGLTAWATGTHRRLNLNHFTATPLTTQTQILSQSPKRIRFDLRTAVIKIEPGRTNQLKLTNAGQNQYQVNQTGTSWSLTEKQANRHQLEIGQSPTITLTLADPQAIQQLTINQLNGTLNLNDLTTNNLAIHHHNGTTFAQNLTLTGAGEVTKDNGRTTIQHLTSNGLTVTIRTGQFKLNGQKTGRHYQQSGYQPLRITSGSGQVSVSQ